MARRLAWKFFVVFCWTGGTNNWEVGRQGGRPAGQLAALRRPGFAANGQLIRRLLAGMLSSLRARFIVGPFLTKFVRACVVGQQTWPLSLCPRWKLSGCQTR